jgi:hypothetical protein
MKGVTITLHVDDAEVMLREAAYEAAKFGALCDYATRRTSSTPRKFKESLEDAMARWRERFIRGKRVVEAFGLEYERTSEEETMTMRAALKQVYANGIAYERGLTASAYKKPKQEYRGSIHDEASKQAAERVVKM